MKPPTTEELFPDLNFYLHRGLLSSPPTCTLRELQDGTYGIDDIYLMNEILDFKKHITEPTGAGHE